MDAITFIKETIRMCESSRNDCDGCPAHDNGFCPYSLHDMSKKNPEEVVSIIEEWLKDHPIKTHQNEFLKLFPEADMQRINTLFPCVMDQTIKPARCVKYERFSSPRKCVECRKDYWIEEVND